MEIIENQIINELPHYQIATTDKSTYKFMSSKDFAKMSNKEVITWVANHPDRSSCIQNAQDAIRFRVQQVPMKESENLKNALNNTGVPDWVKSIIKVDLQRRENFLGRKLLKEKERSEYLKNKPKRRTSTYYKLLDAHFERSIFKVKWQFKEPNKHGDYWKDKKYSRDYVDERQKIEGLGETMLKKLLKEKGEFGYELFDKGGLKEKGFNGFMYSMKHFNSLVEDDKICFFAVYLNNIEGCFCIYGKNVPLILLFIYFPSSHWYKNSN